MKKGICIFLILFVILCKERNSMNSISIERLQNGPLYLLEENEQSSYKSTQGLRPDIMVRIHTNPEGTEIIFQNGPDRFIYKNLRSKCSESRCTFEKNGKVTFALKFVKNNIFQLDNVNNPGYTSELATYQSRMFVFRETEF